jgi:hypothetical protein
MVFLILGFVVSWLAARFISSGVYRYLVRIGYPHPATMRVASFIASFIAIFLTLAFIILSTFRFQR